MEVIIKFLVCFIKEFQPAIPVLITFLGICAFLYAKSGDIQKESFDFKVLFLLLSLLLAAVPVSATFLSMAATGTAIIRFLSILCVATMWIGILYKIFVQVKKVQKAAA